MADAVLRHVYFDVESPACFAGAYAVYKEAKKQLPDLSYAQVVEWLSNHEAYTLHKPARKRFGRNPVVVNGIDVLWEIDLADLSMLKKHNDQYRYLLQVIDVGSRYAWSMPIKTKDSSVVATAFETILKSHNRKPLTVSSDAGGEFKGVAFQRMLKRHSIGFFVSSSDMKCPIIERYTYCVHLNLIDDTKLTFFFRWNRTLKTRMWRYFTHHNTFRYLDVLQKLVSAYNHSPHRTLGCKPAEVTPATLPAIAQRIYDNAKPRKLGKFKFQLSDYVRLSKYKGLFEKGYESSFTREIFQICDRAARPKPVYKVRDLHGKFSCLSVFQSFYSFGYNTYRTKDWRNIL